MIKNNMKSILGSLAAILIAGSAYAENRVFNFLSPSFGGNPQNGVFLFGIAQAQVTRTTRESGVAGSSGSGGSGGSGGIGGTIGGPTIIIPINTGQPQGPIVQTGTPLVGQEAIVPQVN
jgi:hypothetical protein